MPSIHPRIAIIGAGPGGLLLARLFHLSSVPFTLYDAEPHAASRAQGGTLDLHEESGQLALREAGLFAEFQKIARTEGEDFRIADKTGKLFINEVDEGLGNRPEVDRVELRRVLLESLPRDAVNWGCKIISITTASEDSIEHILRVSTPKGTQHTVSYDLVVGADGAWSKVRPLLSEVKPHYSTISTIDCRIRCIDTTHPARSALVGEGSYFAFSDRKGIIAQRNGDGSVHLYIMWQKPESWLKDTGVDWSDSETAKRFLLGQFCDWNAEQKALIEALDSDLVPRCLFMLPTDFTWDAKPGLTMLGDAAHLMTPFAGEGVNLALLDGLELGRAVLTSSFTHSSESSSSSSPWKEMAKALALYEENMFKRSHTHMAETWRNLDLFFREDAPREFVEVFERMMAEHAGAGEAPERVVVVPDLKA